MQDPVASGVEFIVISVEGFQPLTGIPSDSVWGAMGFLDIFGYYFKVCNIFN